MISNFLVSFLRAPFQFFRKLFQTPIASGFYALISKWYLIIMSLSVIVLYWVINGLHKAGVIDAAFEAFQDAGHQIKGFSQHCTPLITDLNEFLDCMINTPEYEGDELTNKFEKEILKEAEAYNKNPQDNNKIFIITPYSIINKIEKIEKEENKSK